MKYEKKEKNYHRNRSGCKSSRDFHYLSAYLLLQIKSAGLARGNEKKRKKEKKGALCYLEGRDSFIQNLCSHWFLSPRFVGVLSRQSVPALPTFKIYRGKEKLLDIFLADIKGKRQELYPGTVVQ